MGYWLWVTRECGRCGGPPMLPGRRLQSPCAAKRRMGSGLLPSDGGEGTAAPGFARGLAPRIDPAAKRKPPPGGRGPGTRMESQRDSVPQPGVAAARRYPGKRAPPHRLNSNGVVFRKSVIAATGRRQDGRPPGHNPLGVDGIGGATRPKVAPRTSGQPWAPGRNRVAVGRAAVRGRRSEVSRELRAEHGQKATCGRWAAQAHGVSSRRPTVPRMGICAPLDFSPRIYPSNAEGYP